ncbi:hypothetical protein EQG41_11625 [Billgrantia azerbaijanica]|nr:hypothetical protein EQG41_11625 [Halomonas azerbaijanica]
MKLKPLTAGLLASLLMAGSAMAMDSHAVEEHMQKINNQYVEQAESDKVAALEAKVEELEKLIRMMLDDQES